MDIIRRNTDYALRAMINLARNSRKGPVSTRQIASQENISYQLACKLMQRLKKTTLVKSSMGPAGGFELARTPSRINLLQIIQVIQGPLKLNRCLFSSDGCPLKKNCSVSKKLFGLQQVIEDTLKKTTLAELIDTSAKHD